MTATSLVTSNHPMNVSIIRCNRLFTRRAFPTLRHFRRATSPLHQITSELHQAADQNTSESIIGCNSPGLFNNTLLIQVQHELAHSQGLVPNPDPTYVAGFKQWKALERHVRKGQPGYQIYAPVTARMAAHDPERGPWRRLARGEKPEPGEIVRQRLIGLRPAYVWDVSQTDGKPLPEPPASVQMPAGQAPPGLWDNLAALVTERGYDLQIVPNRSALGGAFGRTTYATKLVQIVDSLDDAAKTAVLTHDLLTAPSQAPTCSFGRDASGRHAGHGRWPSCRVPVVVGSAPR